MNLHRLKLTLFSPARTPWQSDTLFGHLCWLVVRRKGTTGLRDFLDGFDTPEPPFILSDGFPEGCLPAPHLRGLPGRSSDTPEDYSRFRRWRKAELVSEAQFITFQRSGVLTEEPPGVVWSKLQTVHASLDRNTVSTGGGGSEGNIYQVAAWLPARETNLRESQNFAVHIYARATPQGFQMLAGLLEELACLGYGKDRSVGAGNFGFDAGKDVSPADELDHVIGANGFISLSSYAPAEGDPVRGCWVLRTKRGKLGEEFSLSRIPFKRPLVQFQPGAVFRTETVPRKYYGRIVSGVAPGNAGVIQNCQTIAVPVQLPPESGL